MTIKTIYVDDDNRELIKYEIKFKADERSKKRFKIETLKPPKSPKEYEKIMKKRPELILVDYNLTIPDEDNKVIGVSGITLSTELRQKFPEIPIILFTRKGIFTPEIHYTIKQSLAVIDKIIYKSELFSSKSVLLDALYQLAIGFKKLRESESKNWDDLLKLLKAPKIDYENLKLSNPPISGMNPLWSVSEAAEWISEILMAYPGILYDAVHSATYLGISEKAFLTKEVQQLFKKAKYTGIFAPPEGRWWKSKLLEIAVLKMKKNESSLPIQEGIPAALQRIIKNSIEKSECIYCGKSPAELVCYILKKPVLIEYSLSYNPDSRPLVMDEARVSFEAIITSNEVNDNLFDPLGKEMLADIRKNQKDRKHGIEDHKVS